MVERLKTYNEYLGDLLRKIKADTPVSDFHQGSVILTLAEAIAENDFENAASILSVLQLYNIDAIKDDDLDKRAYDFGLVRHNSQSSTGYITITDSNITKRSTPLYSLKNAPIKGYTEIHVLDASNWSATGSLYIGRGTVNYEGPISYTSIVDNGSYYTIQLGSSLQKDHLISDTVIDAQGTTDRVITAGTEVYVTATPQKPKLVFLTQKSYTILAGEDTVSNIAVRALASGDLYNVGVNSIVNFSSSPFSGAIVTNQNAIVNGKDPESNEELRDRIKNVQNILNNGTADSILSNIINIYDDTEGKQITSAKIQDLANTEDISYLYIDDSTGFSPSYEGQAIDSLLENATGFEEFLQLSNYPLTRPQVVSSKSEPFVLKNGDKLTVKVDNEEESVFFYTSDFINIAAARLIEIVTVINDNATIFNCRLSNDSNYLIIQPKDWDAEKIQVVEPTSNSEEEIDANQQFEFPTDEKFALKLYKNNILINSKERSASLTTTIYNSWSISGSGNLIISVDNTAPQDRTITSSDLPNGNFLTATISDWVTALGSKFAGITVSATSDGKIKFQSNKIGSDSKIEILGGSYMSIMFAGLDTTSTGQDRNYILNRQTGNIQILDTLTFGDSISAGLYDAKAQVLTNETAIGEYDFSVTADARKSEFVVVTDADLCTIRTVSLNIGDTITITDESDDTMRLMASSFSTFYDLQLDDYIYIGYRTGFISQENCGLYKVFSKGDHKTIGSDTYIEVKNLSITAEIASVLGSGDIQAFQCKDSIPQLWTGDYVSNSANTTLSELVDSINDNLININATVYKTNKVRITSTLENEEGNICLPVVYGNATSVMSITDFTENYNPHTANKQTSKDLFSWFSKEDDIVENVFFNRSISNIIDGYIDTSVAPGEEGVDLYSEVLKSTGVLTTSNIKYNDIINLIKGDNKALYKSIKNIFTGDNLGTQFDNLRTLLDYSGYNDFEEFNILKPLALSDTDVFTATLDSDTTSKIINVNMARSAIVNGGSVGVFIPTDISFSADDLDSETGINFSTSYVWSKTLNNTEFKDYATWFRARNLYKSTGNSYVTSNGDAIIRAGIYGPTGEKYRFNIDYPTSPDLSQNYGYSATPEYTLFTYYFGSGSSSVTLPNATTFSVSLLSPPPAPADYLYTLVFSNPITGASAGEVINLIYQDGSGTDYTSTCLIVSVTAPNTLLVRCPEGLAVTGAGTAEVTDIACVADDQGTANQTTVDTTGLTGAPLDATYFIIDESDGLTKVWIDATGSTVEPTSSETINKTVRAVVDAADTAPILAQKIANILSAWTEYNVTLLGNVITLDETINGVRTNADGALAPTGLTITNVTAGTNPASLDGAYFIIYDSEGSVKVYYEVDFSGVSEPAVPTNKTIKVGISGNETANNVASITSSTMSTLLSDFAFGVALNTITITNNAVGSRGIGGAGTTGFTYTITTPGTNSSSHTITSPSYCYPISTTSFSSIATYVNNLNLIEITVVNDDTITVATKDETTSIAYDHDVDPTAEKNEYVSLWDAVGYVESFSNSDPNFILKDDFNISTYDTSVYRLDTCLNYNTVTVGEYFKLIPVTPHNLLHHFNHRAISQLPIVSNVDLCDRSRKLQLISKLAGSDGSVQVANNTANNSVFYVQSDGSVYTQNGNNYLETTINALPASIAVGDFVKLYSDKQVPRISRLLDTDEIQVALDSGTLDKFLYIYKQKENVTDADTVKIEDISSSYDMDTISRETGTVWRWTFTSLGTGAFSSVQEGDLLIPSGFENITNTPGAGWAASNTIFKTGENNIVGFPIINVDDDGVNIYVDVINPHGVAMSSTAIGVDKNITIAPSPILKFKPKHAGKTFIDTVVVSGGATITINFTHPHNYNVNDSIEIHANEGWAALITAATVSKVVNETSIEVTAGITPANGTYVNGFTIYDDGTSLNNLTKYTIRKLNINNLVELKWSGGLQRPYFASCGVGVDDTIVISGNTFSTNNNGTFKVRTVSENSIIYENENAVNEINRTKKFNYKDLNASWISNASYITGVAGTFANLDLSGGWIKKETDPDDYYCSIIGSDTGTASTATIIYLGQPYPGISSDSKGIYSDLTTSYELGVELEKESDIVFYESDSVRAEDSLYIPYYSGVAWFSNANTGTFEIIKYGSKVNALDVTENYLYVENANGIEETVSLAYNPASFIIYEGVNNKYSTIRKVENIAPNKSNNQLKTVYLSPSNKSYKILTSYETKMESLGKVGFSNTIDIGSDGYSYYTGLLRKTQRTVDGYAPDYTSYPGIKAVGATIEVLPPLIQKISLSLSVSTKFGVTVSDIKDEIKTVITNYINGTLGVGDNVILSEVICEVMTIRGISAVSILDPDPTVTKMISISDNEKAYIDSGDISVS
jgi:hypothetical protein